MSKFHPSYRSESLCEAESENVYFATNLGQISDFHFLILFLKTLKLVKFL